MQDLIEWMDTQVRSGVLWYLKRLSGNDTQANGSHQSGPYIPKPVLFESFPGLHQSGKTNPDLSFRLVIASHDDEKFEYFIVLPG